jgi:hypothetical protein
VSPTVDSIRHVVFRSTGTKEVAAAKRIAAQIIESFWMDAGRGAEKLMLPPPHISVVTPRAGDGNLVDNARGGPNSNGVPKASPTAAPMMALATLCSRFIVR